MISNQILQNTIDGLKGITRIDLCIIDVEGKVLAATFPEADKYMEPALAFVESPADSQVVNGYQFFKVFDDHQLEYILLANGDSDDVYMVGKIASFQIQNLLVAYKERFDKDNFIKNLLLDNLLLVDIYNRAKKLHIDTEVRRVVFIVETNRDKDGNELEHGNRRFYRSCDHYQRCDRVSDSGWNSSVADEPCTQCAAFFGSFKDQRKTFYMENDRWNIVTFSLALYTAACGSYRW